MFSGSNDDIFSSDHTNMLEKKKKGGGGGLVDAVNSLSEFLVPAGSDFQKSTSADS